MKNSPNLPKDLPILTLNLAGWNSREWQERTGMKWGERLQKLCDFIKDTVKDPNPFIIALQEVQLSGGKYLSTLEHNFPNYYIIPPQNYNPKKNTRSAINLLLVNKLYCKNYNVMEIDGLENEGSLLYNYVTITAATTGCLCFRVLNVHIPPMPTDKQTEWSRKREAMVINFRKAVKDTAEVYKSEPDLKLIMLGDFNTTPQSNYMQTIINRIALSASPANTPPKPTFGKEKIDYILYSTGMGGTGLSFKFEKTYQQPNLTDHAMLVGGLVLKDDRYNKEIIFNEYK